MLRAEDGQGDGETQIAQGYDFVQTAGPGDIGLGGPQRNEEKQDAGAAHRNRRARDLKKCGENGCVHLDAKRSSGVLSWGHVLPGQYGLTSAAKIGAIRILSEDLNAGQRIAGILIENPFVGIH